MAVALALPRRAPQRQAALWIQWPDETSRSPDH
jgi:hypothetical protein